MCPILQNITLKKAWPHQETLHNVSRHCNERRQLYDGVPLIQVNFQCLHDHQAFTPIHNQFPTYPTLKPFRLASILVYKILTIDLSISQKWFGLVEAVIDCKQTRLGTFYEFNTTSMLGSFPCRKRKIGLTCALDVRFQIFQGLILACTKTTMVVCSEL